MGVKKIIIITNGCPENRIDCAETELFFVKNGWTITHKVDQADCIVLSLCGLRKANEKRSLEMIKLTDNKKKNNSKLIVTGCLPKINNNCIKKIFKGDIINGHNIQELSDLLDVEGDSKCMPANYLVPEDLLYKMFSETKKNKIQRKLKELKEGFNLSDFILYRFLWDGYIKYWKQINIVQPNTFYIKISSGCVHNCSYCVVKKSRGSIKSKTVDAIKTEFMKGLSAGYTQFAMIGTDLGSYGKDIQTDLLVLLREIVSIGGKFEIKLRNVHPELLINQLSEFLTIAKTGKITHITTAIQHGNDRILDLMKREYSIKDCQYAINSLQSGCPNLKLRMQLIVGFPSETHSEFNDSLRLIGENKFDFVEVYPFSARMGTLAAKMPHQIPKQIISWRRLIAIKKLLIKVDPMPRRIFTKFKLPKYS